MFLKYDELRKLSANIPTFDVTSLVNERRQAREKAFAVRPRLDHSAMISSVYLHSVVSLAEACLYPLQI
jgi:hypothetical protein